jgi:single-strand DNA-binding protein
MNLESTGGIIMSLANISIVGNLVKSPEQMHFPSGKVKTTMVVAVNSYGRPHRGGDAADFYKVETWGKLAELAGQYLARGNQVGVSGRLLFDRWTDKEGKNRFTPVVEAAQLSLPPRLKVLEGSPEQSLLPESSAGNIVTGSLLCAEEDPFEEAESTVDGDELVLPDTDAIDGADLVRDTKKKALKVRSA